jgi:hypothetical protein
MQRIAAALTSAMLGGGALLSAAGPAAAAGKGSIFGDWEPPAERVQLPPEPPEPKAPPQSKPPQAKVPAGGDSGPNAMPRAAAKLDYRAIEGTWCDVDSRYVIARHQLMVIFNTSGVVRRYRITGFRYTATTVIMNWTKSNGAAAETTFGRFSADRQRMMQLGVNRTYRRC